MTDYPERISISPVFRQKREDDFYLVDRTAFPGEGKEYVRADLLEAAEAKLAKAREENQRLRYVLGGVRGAIQTGRNEPLMIWRDQINIALDEIGDE